MRAGRVTVFSLPAAALVLAWSTPGCRGPEVAGGDASPQACAECHREVFAEWQGSAHAEAWTSPTFQAVAEPSCAGCHAPDLVLASAPAPPPARETGRETGVDCRSCHMDRSGALVGPFGADERRALEAHPTRKDYFLYRTSRLCATCHQRTAQEAERGGAALGGVQAQSQECHLPSVERKLTQGGGPLQHVDTAFTSSSRQRHHGFGGPATDSSGKAPLRVEWDTQPSAAGGVQARVTLRSRVPHALPTGEQDRGAYELTLVARDAAGSELARVGRSLRRADGAGGPGEDREAAVLDPARPLVVEASFPAGTAQLALELRRVAPRPRLVLEDSHPLGR